VKKNISRDNGNEQITMSRSKNDFHSFHFTVTRFGILRKIEVLILENVDHLFFTIDHLFFIRYLSCIFFTDIFFASFHQEIAYLFLSTIAFFN